MKATIGIYGNRQAGFDYLLSLEGQSRILGTYSPVSGKMSYQDATTCLFAACDEATKYGVELASVHMDVKANGLTYAKVAIIDPNMAPTFGQLVWKTELVR